MNYTNAIIRGNKTIVLTDDEIENIYRFQEHRYRLADAKAHVNTALLSYTSRSDDPYNISIPAITEADLRQDTTEADRAVFKKLLALTDDDLEYISDEFQSKFDCNCDENTLWSSIINDAIK